MMKTIRWAVLVLICAILSMFSISLAEAATGTLKYAFKYKDPTTGVVTNLSYGFVYLHDASKPPPMEKYFSKADYINLSTYGNGIYSWNAAPAGTWYIRITQRKVVSSPTRPYGPPEQGDYTWMQTAPITIPAGGTLDLGTLYAQPFGSAPITITGTIKNASGAPLAGRYVRAQTEPCRDDGYNNDINQCGPVKDLALQPTDAAGKYTILLKDPGTYYIYTSPCITNLNDPYTGNRCHYSGSPAVMVKIRDIKTVDIITY
jgi:hypothetical protein